MRKMMLASVLALWTLQGLAGAAPLMNGPVAPNPALAAQVAAQLASRRAAIGLDPDHGVALARQHPGVAGTQVVRTVHTYKGVPVFGSDSVLVLDFSGQIVAESSSERRLNLGKGRSNKLRRGTGDFDVVPVIADQAAIAAALATMATRAIAVRHVKPPRAELVIYPVMQTERVPAAAGKRDSELNALDVHEVVERYALSYLVHTRMIDGHRPLYHDTVVDARTGQVIDQWNMLQTVVGKGSSQYNGQVPVSTTAVKGGFQMIDPERGAGGKFGGMAITNANHGTTAGKVFANTTNTWGDGKQYNGGSTTNANGQTAAVNALWGLMNTYDMHKNVLGWQSLDGNNTSTYIAAHVNTAYDNAYYSDTCQCMFIGDGSAFTSLGAIDVIGHEMGHGVTAATSDLVYAGESGGLNESSSDIAGEAVEAYARAGGKGDQLPPAAGNDWMLGTEISKSGEPLRWMFKPSLDGASPDAWSTSLKRLDVHYSSGPNNRMFYFLAQGSSADPGSDRFSKYLVKAPAAMRGVGLDKAYRIWFKAATTKFTSTTNYAAARTKMLEAAQELYGARSPEAVAVERAYAAINVGADVAE
jgi:Zn-dependent metalloprotease